MPTKEDAINIMKKVMDPELNIDIWTLGLIYNIDIKENNINIKMTFTSPMCPYGPILVDKLKTNLKENGFKNCNVEIVYDPPWKPSEELKDILGI